MAVINRLGVHSSLKALVMPPKWPILCQVER